MRRLPRPRSSGFRAMLGLALLAWALFAASAVAGPLPGKVSASPIGAVPAAAMHMAASHCDGMSTQQVAAQTSPAAPAGHGCCQAGCHCLSTCSVVLTVPIVAASGSPPRAVLPTAALESPAQAPATPPLRPPIA